MGDLPPRGDGRSRRASLGSNNAPAPHCGGSRRIYGAVGSLDAPVPRLFDQDFSRYGSITLSITWIMPFDWFTFAIVMLPVLPLASVIVQPLAPLAKVSVPPCTVV